MVLYTPRRSPSFALALQKLLKKSSLVFMRETQINDEIKMKAYMAAGYLSEQIVTAILDEDRIER